MVEVAAPAGTVGYSFNAAGERTSMVQPEGVVAYSYDANGFQATVSDWRSDTITVAHDPDGRVVSLSRSNGVNTAHSFDAAGRLSGIAHTGPAGLIDSFGYTLDGNGNRTQVTSSAGTESYTLDELNRLTNVTYPDASVEVFGYDLASHRTSDTRTDGTSVGYTVDAAGQLVTDTDGVTYAYDETGNLTGTSAGDSYGWDDYGRLSTTTVGGTSQTYSYDAAGVRTGVDGAGQVWDRAGRPTLISDGADSYVHTAAGISRTGDGWALSDAVGSVRATTDTAGVVGGQTAYTAFGEPIVPTPGFGFAGEQQDPTGLQHLRARQYNPALGRFLSVDPIQPGAPGTTGWGLYGYAGSNPTTATDPTGRLAFVEYAAKSRVATGAILGAGVGAGASPFVCDSADNGWRPALDLDARCTASTIIGGAVFGGVGGVLPATGSLVGMCSVNGALGAVDGYVTTVAAGRGDPVVSAGVGGAAGCAFGLLAGALGSVIAKYGTVNIDGALAGHIPEVPSVPAGPKGSSFPSVDTPYGPAFQGLDSLSLAGKLEVEQGAQIWRTGTVDRSAASEGQFWSLDHPSTPGFADRNGIPPGNVANASFIESATVPAGVTFVTRPAPGIDSNLGGGIEVVVPSGAVRMCNFSVIGDC